ncbi:MAG: hypothetical protein LN573_02445 [Rickettsia endosymbiont of Oxypoda opaca]|nr:hypothetical protein [Rickettsia endosymbiont of Oxypoda opaca]
MINDDGDNNNNSGLFGSLVNGVKKIWSPTQNRFTDPQPILEEEEKEAEKLKEEFSKDFFATTVKEYYSTTASFDKLKNLLKKYYSTNKDKEEFSLKKILCDERLNKDLYFNDKSLRFVYSHTNPNPKFDIEIVKDKKELSAKDIGEALSYKFDIATVKSEAFRENWSKIILEWAQEHATVIDAGVILEWIEKNVKWHDDINWLKDREVSPSISPLLNIKTLNISNTFFNDANILKLANWLRNNTKVTDLTLTGIGLDNKKAITLAEIFKVNKTIKTVDLRGNKYITGEGIKTLLKIEKFSKSVEKILIGGIEREVNIFDQKYKDDQLKYLENTDLSQKLNGQEVEDIRVGQILDKMIIGGNEIKGNYKEVSMIFGAEGAGKSILANHLTEKQLEKQPASLYNELTGTWTFKIVNPEIMEQKNKPDKIKTPTKFTGEGVIIECPGIGYIGKKTIEDIITSQYYIWQTLNNAIEPQLKLCKFLLTIFNSPGNYTIITTLINNFAEIFKDKNENIWRDNIKKLKDSVSLIVTHADETKTKEQIKNILDEYIINNEKEYHKDIGIFLKDSVNIFCQPTDNNNEISNLVNKENLKLGNFIATKEGEAYLTIPDNLTIFDKLLVNELYNRVYDNIYIIGKIILNFFKSNYENLTNPYKSFYSLDLHQKLDTTAFSQYKLLLQDCFPKSIIHENNGAVAENFYFPALAEITKLKGLSVKGGENFIDDVNILIGYLGIIKDFFSGNEKNQMDNYIHILEQQANFLIFFEKLSDVRDVPNPFEYGRIEPVTVDIHDIIEKMLIPGIKCMKLQKNQPLDYYQEALDWIAKYKKLTKIHEAGIIKNSAKACYKIGLIYVKKADEASKQKKITEQIEDNLSQVGLSLENVVRAKETIHELEQTVHRGMEVSLEGLIKKKEFIEVMEACYLGGVKLENINAVGNPQREEANVNNNGNPPAPLNADEIRQQNVDGNPQQEVANLNNNNNSQRIPLEGLVKKMIEQMIIDNESIKGLESDLKEKGLSLEKVIKQKEVIEKIEQNLDQRSLTLEDIIMNKNLNNRDQINKYWGEAGLSFTKSILNYPERYGAYKALGDLLCKLQNEEALNNAIKYYEIINNDTGVNHAFSLLETLFQNHFNTLKESLDVHYDILANSLNNQERIDSTNAIKGLEAEYKEIAYKKINLKIRQGDYEVKKGKTQPARNDYQKATELANEENDKAKLNDIELKRHKSCQVDIDASKQDNIFIKASDEKLKTGKSWEAPSIALFFSDLKETESIIRKYFSYYDDAEIPPLNNGNAAGNVVGGAEIPPLNNGNAAGNVVAGAEIPPQDNGNAAGNVVAGAEIPPQDNGNAAGNVVAGAEIPPLNNGNAAGNVVAGAEIPPQDNDNAAGNVVAGAEIPPLNNGNAVGNVVADAEIPPQGDGNGDNNLLPFVNLGPPTLPSSLAEMLGEGYHHE